MFSSPSLATTRRGVPLQTPESPPLGRQQLDHQAVSVGQAQAVGCLALPATDREGEARQAGKVPAISVDVRSDFPASAARAWRRGLSWSVPVPASMSGFVRLPGRARYEVL